MNETRHLTINLNEKQSQFWRALFDETGQKLAENDFTEYANWGGYGSGKSLSVMLAVHTICANYPGTVCVYIRETYDQLDDTVISDFNKVFQERGYRYLKQPKKAVFPNGSEIRFRAFDKPGKILGGNIDLIVVSQAEQIPQELFIELFGRRRGAGTLHKKLLITEGNPAEGWAKERYYDNPLPQRCFYVHSTTYDNAVALDQINPTYILDMEQNMSVAERKRKMLGEWGNYEEAVFSEFSYEIHVRDPFIIPESYKRAIGGDYGWKNPSAFVYGAVDYDGNVIIYDEFYASEQTTDQLADAALRYGRQVIIYDHATKRPDRDGKSVWTDLESKGLFLLPSNKDELRNISNVNTRFKKSQLFITRNCVNLIREIKRYKWKKVRLGDQKNHLETPVDKDNHAIDALLYLTAYIEDLRSQDPKIPRYEDSLEYMTRQKKVNLLDFG